MVQEDLQDFTPSLVMDLLRVSRIGDWFLFGRVDQSNVPESPGPSAGTITAKGSKTHALGTSRTKIHLTLKIPFHLSCAQTSLD